MSRSSQQSKQHGSAKSALDEADDSNAAAKGRVQLSNHGGDQPAG